MQGQKGTAQQTFDAIYDLLEERLNQLGPISTGDAWAICKQNHSYSMITKVFRKIMQIMCVQGKANQQINGKYVITKPNLKSSVLK